MPTTAWSSLPSRRTCPPCRSLSGTFSVSPEVLSGPTHTSTDSEARRLFAGLHKVVVIVLPLSLVLLVFGWIFGFVSSLVSVPRMLVGSASYILLCSESRQVSCRCWLTLTSVSCGLPGTFAVLCALKTTRSNQIAAGSELRRPHITAGVNIRCLEVNWAHWLCLKVSKNTPL